MISPAALRVRWKATHWTCRPMHAKIGRHCISTTTWKPKTLTATCPTARAAPRAICWTRSVFLRRVRTGFGNWSAPTTVTRTVCRGITMSIRTSLIRSPAVAASSCKSSLMSATAGHPMRGARPAFRSMTLPVRRTCGSALTSAPPVPAPWGIPSWVAKNYGQKAARRSKAAMN